MPSKRGHLWIRPAAMLSRSLDDGEAKAGAFAACGHIALEQAARSSGRPYAIVEM